jgi:hypothetical protein
VRARFAALDAELHQHAQRLLFGERERTRRPPTRLGYRLSPVPGRAIWAAEAELLSTVPAGALHPLPEDARAAAWSACWKPGSASIACARSDAHPPSCAPARTPARRCTKRPAPSATSAPARGTARGKNR